MTPRLTLALLMLAGGTATSESPASSAPPTATLSVWPASLNGSLTHYIQGTRVPEPWSKASHFDNVAGLLAPDGVVHAQAQEGGVLSVYSAQTPLVALQTTLHPLVRSVKIDWIPESDSASSSTFRRVLASSSVFSHADVVGIHLQVEALHEHPPVGQDHVQVDQLHLQVEESVRQLMEQALPGMTAALQLQRGFLTRSPCDLTSWTSVDVRPLFQATGDQSSHSKALCFASSLPLPDTQTGSTEAFCATPKCQATAARSELERLIWSTPHSLSKVSRPRIASVSVFKQGEHLRAAFCQVFISLTASHTIKVSTVALSPRIVVISSARQLQQVITVEYEDVSLAGDSFAGSTDLLVEADTVPGAMSVSVEGEGFHRRMALNIDISDADFCQDEQSKLLLLLPLSHTVYADLDELRRLERFGHFQVVAFEKHIEIERPSSVSPQHVIALQMDIPQTLQLHAELPIHLRYQAPSTTELYRAAVLLAPQAFVFCPSISSISTRGISQRTTASGDAAAQHFEALWPGSTMKPSDAVKLNHWRRVSLNAPISIQDVLAPVGFLPSQTIVSSVTFASTCIAAVLLVWIALKRSPQDTPPTSQWRPKRD